MTRGPALFKWANPSGGGGGWPQTDIGGKMGGKYLLVGGMLLITALPAFAEKAQQQEDKKVSVEEKAQQQEDKKVSVEEKAQQQKDKKVSVEIDAVSVTATRIERKTAEVPASIAVISEKQLNDTKMFNVKDALAGTPGVLIETTNQGYDSRLIIRGAGLKAPYGVREIMVLRDGIPVTDPDSFTRLDMIDTQEIERIEVVKGPNSTLWGANAAGGVINIISKNPLERSGGILKLGAGEQDTYNFHLSYANNISDKVYYSGSASRRQSRNSWRRRNDFKTTQFGVKPYLVLEDGSIWENNFSYSKADLQLPGDLDETMFEQYKQSGEAKQSAGPWQYSGRYSDSYFYSTKITKQFGKFEFIPLAYVNYWKHHHPVTGRINDAKTWIMGTDMQLNYHHSVAGQGATFSTGITARYDDQKTNYYKYADLATSVIDPPGPRPPYTTIDAVLSDRAGDHVETETRKALLYGLYAQESFSPMDKMMVDIGARVDDIDFDITSDWTSEFNWSQYNYDDTSSGHTQVKKSYTSFSPRIGASYEVLDGLNLFASISTGVQSPSESEINDNPNLEMVKTRSYEAGLKGRSEKWSFDTSIYYSPVKNEVIKVLQADGQTEYANAGKTDKRGIEFSGSYTLLQGLSIGASYAYSDYTFDEFTETVGYGASATNMDRSGNQLPYVPKNQYSLFASWHHSSGFKARIQSYSWGSYYMDNANTEKYKGYDFVTNLMLGYEKGHYDLSLNIDNLFDKRYAVEVTKDTSGVKDFKPAPPRLIMVRFNYRF
jgi:iron complex outermembrane receptor protein